MVRRSLWVGLQLGILAGIVFALVKTVQARRAASTPHAPEDRWVHARTRAEETTLEEATKDVTLDEAPLDEVAEPISEPGPRTGRDVGAAAPAMAAVERSAATPAEKAAKKAAKKATKKTGKSAGKTKKATKAAKKAAGPDDERIWVDADDGACPQSHPIKAKLSSKIFHLPGMLAYDRTSADRCYHHEDDARADGFRRAKR